MTATERDAIDHVLDGAALLGLELDTRYRVLGATVEPDPARRPAGTSADDPRLQLVLHPCSDVAARLVTDDGVVEAFSVEQLLAVVERLGEPALASPVVTADARPLTGQLSLQGAAGPMVTDGRRHAALFRVSGAGRTLVLRATYDEAELRRADGSPLVDDQA